MLTGLIEPHFPVAGRGRRRYPTILNSRHLLEANELAEDILKAVNAHLGKEGLPVQARQRCGRQQSTRNRNEASETERSLADPHKVASVR